MKDNFYKEIEHKRAQESKEKAASKKETKKDGKAEKEEPSLSRSAKYKEREEKERLKEKEKEEKKESEFVAGAKKIFSKENVDKSKAFFAGKFSSYKSRVGSELNTTKEKINDMRSQKSESRGTEKPPIKEKQEGKRSLLPMIIGGVILVPVTVILFVLIASNFWPENNGMDIAGENAENETEEVADAGNEENEEVEDQRFEMERRMAESQDDNSDENADETEDADTSADEADNADNSEESSESSDDLASENVEHEFSEAESEALEEAASAAIEDRENTEETNDSSENTSEESESVNESGDESTSESSEEENTEENADVDVESEDVPSGGTSHTVTGEDNLYQIAIRYYGSGNPDNVQKIRDANGISGNDLSVGQTIVIPE